MVWDSSASWSCGSLHLLGEIRLNDAGRFEKSVFGWMLTSSPYAGAGRVCHKGKNLAEVRTKLDFSPASNILDMRGITLSSGVPL